MSEPGWLAYVGAITGGIGAVTGIAGAILGYIGFRRTGQIKALDLRLELRRTESTLREDIHDLLPLLERAKTSRTRLAAAEGRLHAVTAHWTSHWDTDLAEANSLVAGSSALDVDCSRFSQAELEDRLINIHKLQHKVGRLAQKYQDFLAEDDIGRDHLRENQRVTTQARLDGKL